MVTVCTNMLSCNGAIEISSWLIHWCIENCYYCVSHFLWLLWCASRIKPDCFACVSILGVYIAHFAKWYFWFSLTLSGEWGATFAAVQQVCIIHNWLHINIPWEQIVLYWGSIHLQVIMTIIHYSIFVKNVQKIPKSAREITPLSLFHHWPNIAHVSVTVLSSIVIDILIFRFAVSSWQV